MEISSYKGDETYSIECTGDAVRGDEVCFERATFTGSFRNAKFAGFERIEGTIVADSYGAQAQQHTFTIALVGGGEVRIKGRNLYKNGIFRKPWADESARATVANEKHVRGDRARQARKERKENNW